jgi:predicted RNase H-like nuclease (RuvC/YqgF family)
MSIQTQVNELNSIKNELKSMRITSTTLKKRAKQLEKEIEEYLEEKDQPGLKYKGTAIIREVATKHKIKKKVEQKNDCIQILENYGIHNPEKVLEELNKAKKGSPTEQTKLTFKKYKKKDD